jgi:hypothetical protein
MPSPPSIAAPGRRAKIPPERETITLTPYHWSAYNRIVGRGHGIYFARKWLRDLKPVGAAIVQYLRSKCYANHLTGEYRYEVELDLVEIAEGVGVSLSTVKREFKDNPWLSEFIQRQTQYEPVGSGNRVKKVASLWFVSLDEPIHPDDRERYEAYLRDESRPTAPSSGKVVIRRPKPPSPDTGQNEPYRHSNKCQNEPYPGQIDPGEGQNDPISGQNDTYLHTVFPYSSLPLHTSGTAALPPSHKCVPPEGEAESDYRLAAAWRRALGLLASRVNKPTLEAHLRPLVLASVEDDGTVLLLAPHASTREWIEKRHLPAIQEVLSQLLGRSVVIHLRLARDFRAEVTASLDTTGRS